MTMRFKAKVRLAVSGNGLMCGMLLAALAGGCAGYDARPAGLLPPVNAVLKSDVPLYGAHPDAAANVVLTARCLSCEKFAERRRGDWNHTWYAVRFGGIRVEKGAWGKSDLLFIAMDAWPTAESGIMLGKAPWPYRPGVEMRFWLDATVTPARVLGQEELSAVAPATSPARGP